MHQSTKLIVAILVTVVVPGILALSLQDESLLRLMKLLSMPQKPERYVSSKDIKHPQPGSPMVTSFSWKSCNPADPISADVLLSPDPLTIPGTIMVTAKASLKVDVVAPVKLALTIKKKVFVWITIPCIDGIGSCTYDDACAMLDTSFPPSQPCPVPLATYNLPCHCPFSSGNYSLPASEIEVIDTGIPTWLTSGDYEIKAVASDGNGSELACYSVTLSLT